MSDPDEAESHSELEDDEDEDEDMDNGAPRSGGTHRGGLEDEEEEELEEEEKYNDDDDDDDDNNIEEEEEDDELNSSSVADSMPSASVPQEEEYDDVEEEDEEASGDEEVAEEEADHDDDEVEVDQDLESTNSRETDEDVASNAPSDLDSKPEASVSSPAATMSSYFDDSTIGTNSTPAHLMAADTPSSSTAAAMPKSKKVKKKVPTSGGTGQVGVKRPRSSKHAAVLSSNKKGRTPSVSGLTIPFRTVKKAMKLDPDIPIVQNEAAILTTLAAELFLKTLARQSHVNAKQRGRNTIRYEDVAEARTQEPSYAFLEPLLP